MQGHCVYVLQFDIVRHLQLPIHRLPQTLLRHGMKQQPDLSSFMRILRAGREKWHPRILCELLDETDVHFGSDEVHLGAFGRGIKRHIAL